ncbi:hypothetical protein CC86DRAFT_443346 [Ophiobolus disseminans]|uniref:Uncharacterized protein n=1 Tax=Ophiobolus disseminans TaxID=1469910 RepID=A0A6A7AGH2_9PLEO|nr:hypothetical protein CC86DRAFT_443346 [Ophiobolus disseminans]
MSGIEIAGLVFGVVPLVVEILKHYSAAKSRLVTFSRHVEVACDIQLRLQVASANFNNDCRLLLQAVVDDSSDVSEMIQRPTDKRWQDQGIEIEKRLRGLMEGDYDLCENIVTRVRNILRETHESLVKLEGGLENTKPSHHELTQKIWHAFNTSRKENEFIRQLESLDKWNKALGKLCKQRLKIKKRHRTSSACIIRKAIPKRYQKIRGASQQLAESLHDSWSCTNISHGGHQAKLSLDAHSGHDGVQLDIVVACHPKLESAYTTSTPTVPIWLQIRSLTSVPTMKAPTLPLQTLVDRLSGEPQERSADTIATLKPKGAKSKKRVRFDDPGVDGKHARKQVSVSTGAGTLPARSFVMLDLKTTKSVCCHVSQVSLSSSACQDGCVGYLDVQAIPTARLIFYDASKLATKERHQPTKTQEAAPIISLVNRLQILQQITFAHKLAEAVLQYHSTSWLPQAWTLQDVGYFKDTSQTEAKDIADALRSLHLSKRFPGHQITAADTTQEFSELKHTYGIRNITLAKLGVALLEICAQRDMTTSSLDHTPYEVVEARKMLDEKHSSIMTLGNRYLEIVRKCIYCDFSCDDDLKGEALQSAVYTEVVCVLQEMKSRWEKFFGI